MTTATLLHHALGHDPFFSPRQIGPLPDNKQHTIAYRSDLVNAFLCSEPQEKPKWTFDEISTKIEALFKQKQFGDAPAAARTIREEVVELASTEWRRQSAWLADQIRVRIRAATSTAAIDAQQEETVTDLLVAREVARVDLGVELVLAQPG